MRDLIKDLKFIIKASNDCEKDNKIEQLILDYIKKVETEKAINYTPCCGTFYCNNEHNFMERCGEMCDTCKDLQD